MGFRSRSARDYVMATRPGIGLLQAGGAALIGLLIIYAWAELSSATANAAHCVEHPTCWSCERRLGAIQTWSGFGSQLYAPDVAVELRLSEVRIGSKRRSVDWVFVGDDARSEPTQTSFLWELARHSEQCKKDLALAAGAAVRCQLVFLVGDRVTPETLESYLRAAQIVGFEKTNIELRPPS